MSVMGSGKLGDYRGCSGGLDSSIRRNDGYYYALNTLF